MTTHLLRRHAERRADRQEAGVDADADDDGVAAVEDVLRHDAQAAREDGDVPVLVLARATQARAVRRERVEQVVDDVGGEDGDADRVGELLRLALHLYVEREDDGVPGGRRKTGDERGRGRGWGIGVRGGEGGRR